MYLIIKFGYISLWMIATLAKHKIRKIKRSPQTISIVRFTFKFKFWLVSQLPCNPKQHPRFKKEQTRTDGGVRCSCVCTCKSTYNYGFHKHIIIVTQCHLGVGTFKGRLTKKHDLHGGVSFVGRALRNLLGVFGGQKNEPPTPRGFTLCKAPAFSFLL